MPKQQKITLAINGSKANPDNPTFSMSGSGVSGEIVTFRNDPRNDGIDVIFEIDNPGEVTYKFAALNDACRATDRKIKHNDHCPASNDKWDGFKATAGGDGPTLTVHNENQSYQYFGFALYVTYDGNKGQLIPYDPIGNNQNGGMPLIDA